MKRIVLCDMGLAEDVEAGLHRRTRLLRNITGNGTFAEEEYAELIAQDVERALAARVLLLERREQMSFLKQETQWTP